MRIEVDGDVDFKRAEKFRDLTVGLVAGVDEAIEGMHDALMQEAAVAGLGGNGNSLESRPVVLLEQSDHQLGGRVLAEIGADIGETNAVVRVALAPPERFAGRIFAGAPRPCAGELVRRAHGDRQGLERSRRRLAIADIRDKPRPVGLDPHPIAGMHPRMHQIAKDVVEIGLRHARSAVCGDRIVSAGHLCQPRPERRPCLGVLRIGGDDALEHSDGLVEPPPARQHVADDQQGLGAFRFDFQSLAGKVLGRVDLVLIDQRPGEIGQDREPVGNQRKRRAKARFGPDMVACIRALQRLEEEALGAFGVVGGVSRNDGLPTS